MKYEKYSDFKDEVTKVLISFGIYFRNAELAVIDMNHFLKEGMFEKRSPEDVAVIMYDRVKLLYNDPK